MEAVLYVMRGRFIEPSSEELTEERVYSIAGWWIFTGFEVEYMCLRTREDDNDLRLAIARERGSGRVVAVLTVVRSGAKEFGWT